MRLRCTKGPCMGQEWDLPDSPLTIGRDTSCEVRLADPRISRVHAEIRRENGHFILRDCDSSNGTAINDMPVQSRALLDGDRVQLGSSILEVLEEDPAVNLELTATSISLAVPVANSLEPQPRTQALPSLSSEEIRCIAKRMQNLEVVYKITHDLTQDMVLEDLYRHLCERLFVVFPHVWRICLLRREGDEPFRAEFSRARSGDSGSEVPISNTILQAAAAQQAGLIASNAPEDQRFQASDSLVRSAIQSVMCSPLVYRDAVIGALYLDTGKQPAAFDEEDLALLTALSNQVAVSIQNATLYENVQEAYHQAVLALVNMMETRDPYTIGHTQRTCRYALGIGQAMHLTPEQMQLLKMAAQLHDIGKIGVEQNVLDKAESLSEVETRAVREHVRAAERILSPIDSLRDVIPIILGHHENFDGSGYPGGLKGEEILIESRILAVADAFDAMTTQRAYNSPLTFSQALERCAQAAGKQFDPLVVQQLGHFLKNNRDDTTNRRRNTAQAAPAD